jgi:hypothetical protein
MNKVTILELTYDDADIKGEYTYRQIHTSLESASIQVEKCKASSTDYHKLVRFAYDEVNLFDLVPKEPTFMDELKKV